MTSRTRGFALAAASLLLILTAAGCSKSARSEPLDVTYYYLPG